MESETEVVLVGTSPLMMIRALDQHARGRRVTVVQRDHHFGGAWYTQDVWSWKSLEMGSHVVRNRPEAYRFFEDVLGIELSPPEGLEFGFVGGRRFALPQYRMKNALKSLWGDARKLRFGALGGSLPGTLRIARSLRIPFQYPLQGCVAIVERLAAMLRDTGIDVRCGVEVKEIEVAEDRRGGVCHTSDGPLRFEQVVIGQNAHCPLRVGNEPFPVEVRTKHTSNVLLHLSGRRLQRFMYFELRADRLLRRVRNIGVYLKPPIEEPEMVVVAHLNRKAYEAADSDEACAAAVVERLVELGVVEASTRLVDFEFDHMQMNKIENAEMARIAAALSPAVVPMRTWDLGEELTTMLRSGEIALARAPR